MEREPRRPLPAVRRDDEDGIGRQRHHLPVPDGDHADIDAVLRRHEDAAILRAEMRQDEMLEDVRGDFANVGQIGCHLYLLGVVWEGADGVCVPVASHFPTPVRTGSGAKGLRAIPALSARQRSPSATELHGTVCAIAASVNHRCYDLARL